ncbi:hypothetical protein [Elizabethkingia meningoseptica]|uniref:hypothetical protein n=1 Tax=Elizabethkingia meningoseptica TaxID=238 RepID=UPI003891C03F
MSNRKTLTTNSLILSLRMLVSMVIALFTSRLILGNLGEIDYGIYNVLAGVIALFSFIQTALVGATSRFLTFQLGAESGNSGFKNLLNASVVIHILASIVILLFAETLGVYFVNHILDIPEEKMFIANIVFQISVINTIVIFLSLPFESVLFAYEKMNVYAYISIIESVLKLIIAVLIGFFAEGRIFYYALLLLVATIIIKFLIFFFAKRCIHQYRFRFFIEKEYLKPLLSFFSWDLYGNLSVVIQSQGVNVLQNVFFGPIANASIAISNQILFALGSFSSNILYAIKPQIIKAFARNDNKELNSLINLGTKFSFIITFLLSAPVYFKMDFIMELWLKTPPKYAVIYAKVAIIINLIGGLNGTINHAIHATGKIKALSFITGSFYLLIFPITYLFYKIGYPSISSYYIALVVSGMAVTTNLIILKLLISEFQSKQFLITIIRIISMMSLIYFIGYYLDYITFFDNKLLDVSVYSIILSLISFIIIVTVLLNNNERIKVINFVKNKLKK